MKRQSALIKFLAASTMLAGCSSQANLEEPRSEDAPLTANLTTAEAFCPAGFAYNASTLLCESATVAVGPFTQAMVSKCKLGGGGTACEKANWSRDFARKIRGTAACPPGAARESNGLCTEGENAFGPFTKAHVKNCTDRGGGPSCESMRWSRTFAIATLPASGIGIKIGTTSTWLKVRLTNADGTPVQAADLAEGTEKCALAAGAQVALAAAPTTVGSHLLVTTKTLLAGCSFSKGYIYAPHVVSGAPATNGLTRPENAFLGVIGYAEGTGTSYDYSFGFHRFTSFADHPRQLYCSGSLCSDAAGRYQFLSTTWDSVVQRTLRLPDFGPASQDRGALLLITNRGVTGLRSEMTYQQFSAAMYKCAYEWASLPGSPYGQPVKTMAQVWAKYQEGLK